jgi:hypothetical protein
MGAEMDVYGTALERFIKYARVKVGWFRTKVWVSKKELDALVVAVPSADEDESGFSAMFSTS